jgi:hypothetical protein
MTGGAADAPRTFRYFLAGFVFLLAVFGFLSYRLLSKSDFWDFLRRPALNQGPRQQAVVHGEVLRPEELEAHGKLYFVPMGRQVVQVESLAAYYRDKFKIEVTVLPEVAIDSAAYDSPRSQYIAEEMILEMKRAQPNIARAAESIIIILTDEDIYPRSLGWKFTYSFHTGYKFAVVSSHRNDPAFWDSSKPHDAAEQLAGMKQMLTKYIAMLYFHLPHSFDPTSIMYQPLTPNGGSDNLYESDLHSEESANGFRGSGWPCLFYSYSHRTGAMRRLSPFVEECGHLPVPASPQEEIFETLLSSGEFFQFALDFQLDSAPPSNSIARTARNIRSAGPLALAPTKTTTPGSTPTAPPSLASSTSSVKTAPMNIWFVCLPVLVFLPVSSSKIATMRRSSMVRASPGIPTISSCSIATAPGPHFFPVKMDAVTGTAIKTPLVIF